MSETENFLKENFDRLKKYIFIRVPNSLEAEEIFQQTLISAHESYAFFEGRSSFFTWVCGIANHEIADFYRKKKIRTFLFSRFPFLEEIVSEALGPEEQILKKEAKEEVKRVLGRLSEGYSLILRLKYYQGLSVGEIARRLGTSVKAVESKLSRARAAFRAKWELTNKK